MEVFRQFRFHAARHLPKLDEHHICKQTHGHTFNLTIYVNGEINETTGFVMDFFDIDIIVKKHIINCIDHKLLNDIPNLENPTSEVLVEWIWNKIEPKLNGLVKLVLWENEVSRVEFKGT